MHSPYRTSRLCLCAPATAFWDVFLLFTAFASTVLSYLYLLYQVGRSATCWCHLFCCCMPVPAAPPRFNRFEPATLRVADKTCVIMHAPYSIHLTAPLLS